MLLAQFYYYLYRKNEIFLTDIHRWNFSPENKTQTIKQQTTIIKTTGTGTTTTIKSKNKL